MVVTVQMVNKIRNELGRKPFESSEKSLKKNKLECWPIKELLSLNEIALNMFQENSTGIEKI